MELAQVKVCEKKYKMDFLAIFELFFYFLQPKESNDTNALVS
jgi:hypothetical protein